MFSTTISGPWGKKAMKIRYKGECSIIFELVGSVKVRIDQEESEGRYIEAEATLLEELAGTI